VFGHSALAGQGKGPPHCNNVYFFFHLGIL
jgi:hypothetical protein